MKSGASAIKCLGQDRLTGDLRFCELSRFRAMPSLNKRAPLLSATARMLIAMGMHRNWLRRSVECRGHVSKPRRAAFTLGWKIH